MKFKIIEGNIPKGYKAKIKISGTSIPLEIYYTAENYNNFDALIKATYGDKFLGYVSYPKLHYK